MQEEDSSSRDHRRRSLRSALESAFIRPFRTRIHPVTHEGAERSPTATTTAPSDSRSRSRSHSAFRLRLPFFFNHHDSSSNSNAVMDAGTLNTRSLKTIHQAAREGEVDEVKSIIANRMEKTSIRSGISFASDTPFVDELDDNGMSALHYACRHDNVDVVQALLSSSADPLVQNDEGVSPIHFAGKFGSLETAKLMVQYLDEPGLLASAVDSFGSCSLHYACQRSDADVLEFFLETLHASPDVGDKIGETPLHWACADGFTACVEVLLKYNANPKQESHRKVTPLHFAARNGHIDIMALLLGKSKDLVNLMDDDGRIPLHFAVASSSEDAAKLLIEHRSDPNARAHANKRTPLHTAAKYGVISTIELLLSHGAKRIVTDSRGYLPVHRAAAKGHKEAVDLLLKSEEAKSTLEAVTKRGETPLALASQGGHTEVMQLLLSMGASALKPDKLGKSCLHHSVEQGHVAATKLLIETAANTEAEGGSVLSWNSDDGEGDDVSLVSSPLSLLESTDKYEQRPLHFACIEGHLEIARLLIAARCSLDEVDDADQTPMHLAVKHGHYKIVQVLVKEDSALLASEDDTAQTALHIAAKYGHPRIITLLIDNGADIDAADDFHQTPLMEAAMAGELACVRILLDNDAQLDLRDKKGLTALLAAAQNGRPRVVRLLLKSGANIAHQDKKGETCLDIAAFYKNIDVAKAILDHPDWHLVLKRRITEAHIANGQDRRLLGSTPFKQLIINIPQAAAAILDKCQTTNGLTPDHADYEITYNYEYILDSSSQGNMSSAEAYMTDLNRRELLLHPLYSTLLDQKWNLYGKYVYYTSLLLYLFFVICVTIFVADNDVRNPTVYADLSPRSKFATWAIIIYCGYGILSEFYQLLTIFKDYFDWRNILDWCVYITSLQMVLYAFSTDSSFVSMGGMAVNGTTTTSAPVLQFTANWENAWFAGSVAVFLTWMNLLVFVRRFGSLGVYVLMFTDTLNTVVKVMSVFSVLIIAFGLSFFILLRDQPTFSTPGNSLTRTMVMMTGEYNFDNIFTGGAIANCTTEDLDNRDCFIYRDIMYPLFIAFVLLMNISVMNLLIGLAVGDIEKVSEQAAVNKQAIKAKYLNYVYKSAPRRIKSRIQKVQSVRPNSSSRKGVLGGLAKQLLDEDTSSGGGGDEVKSMRERTEGYFDRTEALVDNIKSLQQRVAASSRAIGHLTEKLSRN